MAKKKPQTFEYRTVSEMHAVPIEKIDHFCRDLALWLTMAKIADLTDGVTMTTPRDVFGWIDDGKHDVTINMKIKGE